MTTEPFELQAVSDEELQAANGGANHPMPIPSRRDSSVQTADNHGLQSLLMPRSRTVATIG